MATKKLRLSVEPPLPVTTEFTKVPQIRSVITDLDGGRFYRAAVLIERMLWNPRLRGAVGTRLNGLIATQIRWEPARENREARRVARDLREDWPHMAPSPQRQQLNKWGLLLGFGLGQRVPMDSPASKRLIFRLRPYWPGWAYWQWYQDVYKVQVRGSGPVDVEAPSLRQTKTSPADSPWVVHEPFGEHSWREGLAHSLWRSWFGHDLAFRDLNRASEKHGIGAYKLPYPAGNDEAVGLLKDGLRNLGSEGVIPLPQFPANENQDKSGFDVAPLEFAGGAGVEVIEKAFAAAATEMAIVLLGHNLTTEVKGGSFAAAGVGEYIRSDIKQNDAEAEWATLGPQLVAPWAEANYGDPELAPRAVYITDPPTVNQAMAQTYASLAQALRELATLTGTDLNALCERFQLPMLPPGVEQVQVPADTQPGAPAEPAEPKKEEQPE